MKQAAIRLALPLALIVLIVSGSAWSLRPHRPLLDFGTFVEAGAAYEQGLNPYKLYVEFPENSQQISPTEDKEHSPNLNPPISLYPFREMAGMNWVHVRNVLTVVSIVLYGAVCAMLLRAYPWQRRAIVGMWLMALAGLWFTLLVGQIYMLMLLCGVSALLLIERGQGYLLAGILIGLLVAIKPNFAIWPLLLLLAGHRKPAVAAMAVAALISVVPLALEGPTVYQQWLDAASGYPRASIAPNAAMFGEASRLGVPALGLVAAGCLTLAGAFYAWRARLTAREASAAGIMITLLVGPLTWIGYTLLSLPLLLSRRWRGWEVAVGATMVVPAGMNLIAGELRLAGLVMLTVLLARDAVQARQVRAEETQSSESSVALGVAGEAA